MRYSSLAHWPRSISLQRSEQNGRQGLVALYSEYSPHPGQMIFLLLVGVEADMPDNV